MDFTEVIRSFRNGEGRMFARKGWNGKGMFIYCSPGKVVDVDNWDGAVSNRELATGSVTILPHIDMCNARGERVIGWLASQEDMLADDWYTSNADGVKILPGMGVLPVADGFILAFGKDVDITGMPCPKCGAKVIPEPGDVESRDMDDRIQLVCPECGEVLGRIRK